MSRVGLVLNNINKRECANFGLCSLGFFISLFGSSIYTFAIGLHVLNITGSGLSYAITIVLGTIPMVILNPFAGVLADKLEKKKIVVLMDLLNGVLFLTLYLLSTRYGLKLSMIYISAFITTILTTLFNISFQAAIPNIVSERLLMSLNSVDKILNSTSTILGPMIGGLVFAKVDIRFFILINGISFIFSGIIEIFINFKFNINKEPKESNKEINFKDDIKEGIKYLFNNKEIVGIYTIFISLNFATGFSITVPLPYIVNNILKLGSEYFGIIQGAFSIGMIIGAVFVKKIYSKVSYKKLLLNMSTVMSFLTVTIGLPLLWINKFSNFEFLIYYCTVMTIIGIVIAFVDIPLFYILQTLIPDEYRGRVLSIGLSAAKACVPVAVILSGALINKIMPVYITMTGGLVLLICNIFYYKIGKTKTVID